MLLLQSTLEKWPKLSLNLDRASECSVTHLQRAALNLNLSFTSPLQLWMAHLWPQLAMLPATSEARPKSRSAAPAARPTTQPFSETLHNLQIRLEVISLARQLKSCQIRILILWKEAMRQLHGEKSWEVMSMGPYCRWSCLWPAFRCYESTTSIREVRVPSSSPCFAQFRIYFEIRLNFGLIFVNLPGVWKIRFHPSRTLGTKQSTGMF